MNAAQLHLAFTHVPVILVILGVIILIIAMIIRNRTVTKTAFYILVAAGLFSIPVYLSGEGAEEIVENLPGVSHDVVEEHEDLGKLGLIVTLITSILALAGLVLHGRRGDLNYGVQSRNEGMGAETVQRRVTGESNLSRYLKIAVLIAGLVASGIMLQVAHLGGQVRHTEIRPGFTSQETEQPAGEGREQEEENEE